MAPYSGVCGGCDGRWTGERTAHCGACHATFGGVDLFDRHRRGGVCRAPDEVAERLVGEVWRGPERPVDTIPA